MKEVKVAKKLRESRRMNENLNISMGRLTDALNSMLDELSNDPDIEYEDVDIQVLDFEPIGYYPNQDNLDEWDLLSVKFEFMDIPDNVYPEPHRLISLHLGEMLAEFLQQETGRDYHFEEVDMESRGEYILRLATHY